MSDEIKWRLHLAADVPPTERDEWARTLIAELAKVPVKQAECFYMRSGDSMVVITRDEDGTVELFDTRIRRAFYGDDAGEPKPIAGKDIKAAEGDCG